MKIRVVPCQVSRKIREEWRRKEKKNEDEGEEADGGNWMIERKIDVIFYENVAASGKFYKFLNRIE